MSPPHPRSTKLARGRWFDPHRPIERGGGADPGTYRRGVRVRSWRLDALWVAVSIAAAFVVTAMLLPDAKLSAPLLLAVLAGLVTVGVRRWPLAVLLTLAIAVIGNAVTGFVGPFVALCMLVLVGVIAYRYSWRAAWLAWSITYLAMLSLGGFRFQPLSTATVLQVLAEAGLAAAPVAFGRYVRGVRSAAEVAEERVAETEAFRYVETRAARLAERSRLARDLHDIVAHHVGAMTLRASSGRLALDTSGDAAVAAAALSDIAETGRHVLDELRGLLAVLRDPDAIDEEAMVIEPKAAIADAVARVRGAGVPVTLDLDPDLARASLLVRTTVARIVQEALTNVLKHAGPGTATRLTASVEPPHTLRLRIDNDAPAGPQPAPAALPASGHGLTGMRDRVALLGGVLTAGPTPDRGWSVAVALPAPPALPVRPDPAASVEESRA